MCIIDNDKPKVLAKRIQHFLQFNTLNIVKFNIINACDLTIGSCFSVRTSSNGCTREVWRAREKRKSCSRRNSLEKPSTRHHSTFLFSRFFSNLNNIRGFVLPANTTIFREFECMHMQEIEDITRRLEDMNFIFEW